MTLDKLTPTPEQQDQLRSAFRHAVRSLLLDNLEGLAAGGAKAVKIAKKVAAKNPRFGSLVGLVRRPTSTLFLRWMRRRPLSKEPSGWFRR
jgi:hypothetical protein